MTASVAGILQEMGYACSCVKQTADAQKVYKTSQPDMVLLIGATPDQRTFAAWVREQTGEAIIVACVPMEARMGLDVLQQSGVDDLIHCTPDGGNLQVRLAFLATRAKKRQERRRIKEELAARVAQQAVVSTLGEQALAGVALPDLMAHAVVKTAEALMVPLCKVLVLEKEQQRLLLGAGVGWQEGLVGRAYVSAERDSQAGYTLATAAPVVVEDLRTETRFQGPALLHDHGVVSGVSVLVAGGDDPYGVLGAHTTTRRTFSHEDVNFLQAVANILAAAVGRHRREHDLLESEAKARAVLETTVDGIITIDDQGRIESFNKAAEHIFGYLAEEVMGKNVSVLMPTPYREEHDGYIRSYHETGHRKIIGIGREVLGRRKDGSTFPMDLAVSQVLYNGRRTYTGIIRDVSERRDLEQEIIRIGEQERRRIGQDLHDGLGQMLTGIGLIAKNLARRQAEEGRAEAAEEVAEIADLVKEADQQARILARGLIPVELDANGLSAALLRLVTNAERLFGITCSYEEIGIARIHDSAVAMHLYRIAQEAVSNAAKHSGANVIKVILATGKDQLRLRIQDDGHGLPEVPPVQQEHRGMGLKIMRYRAQMIGGTLEIRRRPARGTLITCTLRLHPG